MPTMLATPYPIVNRIPLSGPYRPLYTLAIRAPKLVIRVSRHFDEAISWHASCLTSDAPARAKTSMRFSPSSSKIRSSPLNSLSPLIFVRPTTPYCPYPLQRTRSRSRRSTSNTALRSARTPPVSTPPVSAKPQQRPGTFIEENLDIVSQRIQALCRRHRLSLEEAEDFRSAAMVKLLEKSARLEQLFEGRSNLATYFDSVLRNILRDYRISKWGKWRASKAAQRLGPLALHLERQIYRNRLSPHDAVQKIAMDHNASGYGADTRRFEEELWEIVSQLPTRVDRRAVVDTDALEELVDSSTESPFEVQQALHEIERLKATLLRALHQLSPKQRNVLQLRYSEGLSFGEIQTRTGVSTAALYRMVSRTLRKLRSVVDAEGLCADTALQAQASEAGDFCIEWLFASAGREG